MLEDVLQDDLSLFALPLYLAAVLVEAWHAHRHQSGRYRLGDTLASFSMLAASAIVELLPRLFALAAFVYLHEVSPLRDVIGRQWWAWLLLRCSRARCAVRGSTLRGSCPTCRAGWGTWARRLLVDLD